MDAKVDFPMIVIKASIQGETYSKLILKFWKMFKKIFAPVFFKKKYLKVFAPFMYPPN